MSLAWANFGPRGDPPEYNNQEGCELIEQGELVDRPWEERQRNPALDLPQPAHCAPEED